MRDSKEKYFLPSLFLLTYLLPGIALYLPLKQMWGINHLIFLSNAYTHIYWLILFLLIYFSARPVHERIFGEIIENLSHWIWDSHFITRLIIIGIAMFFFYSFSMQIHLLGDGYTWLSNFGNGETYIHKMTEPGSIYLVRVIQSILEGYTQETALSTFRIISIISGAIFIYNIISIVGKLCSNNRIRVLALSSFLFSGSILLFFGYVEFYPLLWAFISITINLSLVYLKKGHSLYIVCIAYILAVLVHLQAIYFLPGFMYLIVHKIKSKTVRKISYSFIIFGLLTTGALSVWLYNTRIDFEILILPFFEGRPLAIDYSVLSLPHLLDIFNLLMTVFPGCLILSGIWLLNGQKKYNDPTSRFLLILSGGSLLFLILFGAGITMGRDWDIMALSLFAPFLLLLYQIDRGDITIPYRTIVIYVIMVCFFTVTYLSVNIGIASAEKRVYALLNNRHENSWVIYANYFLHKNNKVRFNEILQERDKRFPGTPLLKQAYRELNVGHYNKAMDISKRLININKYNPSYLQVMGNSFGKFKIYDSSEYYYNQAALLEPYNSGLFNEIGQLYVKQIKYDKAISAFKTGIKLAPDSTFIIEGLALAFLNNNNYSKALSWADTLFLRDKNSPGGNLIKMTIYLRNNEFTLAADHYRAYLKYGKKRSDYQNIKEYYKNLENY